MVDDPQDQQDQGGYEGGGGGGFGGGGGGGGGLFGLLPLLFTLFRGPKGCLWIVIIAVAGYFFLGRSGCNNAVLQNASRLATGGFLDPKQFSKSNIYEPLADDNSKNPLPESANLQKYAPAVGDQGQQGSCVAWSSAYVARTILESVRTGQDPNSLRSVRHSYTIKLD
jgi:hypothetical protein